MNLIHQVQLLLLYAFIAKPVTLDPALRKINISSNIKFIRISSEIIFMSYGKMKVTSHLDIEVLCNMPVSGLAK